MEDARILTYTADENDRGRTVRDVLKGHFHLVAHDLARAKYRTDKGITVNYETVLVNRFLMPGDVLRVRLLYEDPQKTVPAKGPLDILYEDEDLIALNKPAGVVVHPSHGHFADTLANFLAEYFREKGEPHEVRSAGRLDKDTSGVLLFAKSRTAAAVLNGQTSLPGVEKEYLALAEGIFENNSATVEAPISREYEEKIRRVVREDGAPARTHFQMIRQFDGYALISVRIETGRTHQIRVHMAHIGHPLIGDPIYGHGTEGTTRALLHAYRASFVQPFTHRAMDVTAPLPEDFAEKCGDFYFGFRNHSHIFSNEEALWKTKKR